MIMKQNGISSAAVKTPSVTRRMSMQRMSISELDDDISFLKTNRSFTSLYTCLIVKGTAISTPDGVQAVKKKIQDRMYTPVRPRQLGRASIRLHESDETKSVIRPKAEQSTPAPKKEIVVKETPVQDKENIMAETPATIRRERRLNRKPERVLKSPVANPEAAMDNLCNQVSFSLSFSLFINARLPRICC
jgi:hypothetical protein